MKAIVAVLAAAPAALGWSLFGATADALAASLRPRDAVDPVATQYIRLERVAGDAVRASRLSRVLAAKHERREEAALQADPTASKTANLTFLYQNNYVGDVSVNGEKVKLVIDTLTSDTWIVKNGFTCVDASDQVIDSSECFFGPALNNGFTSTVPDVQKYAWTFPDDSYLVGQAGYLDLTVGGINVRNQQIVLVDEASYLGDGVTSGVLALGYSVTGQIFTSDNTNDWYPGSPAQKRYDPVFATMVKQGLNPSIFSLAMDKAAGTGYLAFGGLPPVSHNSDFGKTSIRIVESADFPVYANEISYYTIVPDAFVIGGNTTATLNFTYNNPYWNASRYDGVQRHQFPVIVDSSTTLSVLPEVVVREFARQVARPVRRARGYYWAHCDAALPRFGVVVGGKTFYFSNADLIQQDVTSEFDENGAAVNYCALGLVDSVPEGPFVLGDTFLNNVVSVFDVGNSELRFYARR